MFELNLDEYLNKNNVVPNKKFIPILTNVVSELKNTKFNCNAKTMNVLILNLILKLKIFLFKMLFTNILLINFIFLASYFFNKKFHYFIHLFSMFDFFFK